MVAFAASIVWHTARHKIGVVPDKPGNAQRWRAPIRDPYSVNVLFGTLVIDPVRQRRPVAMGLWIASLRSR